MSKHYTAKDILQMAVNLQEPDLSADMDGDGKITPGDARLAQDGVDVPDPGCAPDFFPSGMKNVFFTGPNGETLEFVEYAK